MANPWLEHVKKERAKAKNKGKSYKQILVISKGTYRKGTKSTTEDKKAKKKVKK